MITRTYPIELIAPDIEPYREGNTGIEFVTTFDSGVAGPHVLINAVTHGNEICGAITLDYLFRAGVRPLVGKLSLSFNNHAAYLTFDPDNPEASRYVDEDFNRLWLEERLDGDENTSELSRARELRPLFNDVDFMLDIHSMSTDSAPLMICHGHEKEKAFSRVVNYPSYVMCGSGHIVGRRLIEYTPFSDPTDDKVALLVECGQHWASATGPAAIDTTLHFLHAAGTVSPDFVGSNLSNAGKNPPNTELWEVVDGIIAKTDNFQFVSDYVGCEVVAKAGTVIATDGGEDITTPHDNCLLMMPNHKMGAGQRKLRLCKLLK